MIIFTSAALVLLCATLVAVYKPAYLLPIGLTLGLLLARPSLVGERAPWLGPVIIIIVAGAALLTNSAGLKSPQRSRVWPVLVLFLGYIWLLLRDSIVNDEIFPIITSSVSVFIPLFVFGLVALRRPGLMERTRSVLVGAIIFLAASSAVTLVAGVLVGFGALRLGILPLGYERANAGFFLPFTFSYGAGGEEVPRFLGLSREPGMAAIFYGWAFFAIPQWGRRNALRVILLFGLVSTQSTAGLGIFGVTWLLSATVGAAKFKPFLTLAVTLIGSALVWIALFSPTFGYLSKQDQLSNTERLVATRAGVTALLNEPFMASTDAPRSSINLIAGIAATGAPWLIIILIFLASMFVAGRRTGWQTYVGMLIGVSVLLSQPLYGSTALFALVVLTYYTGRQTARHISAPLATVRDPVPK